MTIVPLSHGTRRRLGLLVALGSALAARAQSSVLLESQLKAHFLYNFAQFVEWPAAAFTSADEPLRFCIVAQDSLSAILDSTVRGKKIGERSLEVWRLTAARETSGCHVLYLSAQEGSKTRAWLETARTANILTVGEAEDFLKAGGIAALRLEGFRVRVQVGLRAAESANLQISSKLLSIAEVIRK